MMSCVSFGRFANAPVLIGPALIGQTLALLVSLTALIPGRADASSIRFTDNLPNDYDYGRQLAIPDGFGDGEFTMELWIKLDPTYPIGTTSGQGSHDRVNWSSDDNAPYSAQNWWYHGNFLLDGFNNGGFTEGTMALQFYGGGRIRWLLGDGKSPGPGGVWSVGVYPAADTSSLLDGRWHQITLVRRWSWLFSAELELWIDGQLVATETSSSRVNLAAKYWDGVVDGGWYWGAEKQAAENSLSTYEDYKGLLDEIRFWSMAKTPEEIRATYNNAVAGNEPGLVGAYSMQEGAGKTVCNRLSKTECIRLFQAKPGVWSSENAPLVDVGAPAESLP